MEKIYLKEALFKNCQSLKDVSYELIDGVNVITAPNSTGKSVFYKALKVAVGATFFSNTELRHLISYGEQSAVALFVFSDDSCGGFKAILDPDGLRRVALQYIYQDCDESEFSIYNEPHPDVVRKLSIVLDDKTKFIMNVLDPDQELLFVNSHESTNSSIVKLVSDNPELEILEPKIESNIEYTQQLVNKSKSVYEYTNTVLDTFDTENEATLQLMIDIGNYFIRPCRELIYMYNDLDRLLAVDDTDASKIEELLYVFKMMEDTLDSLDRLLPVSKINYNNYSNLSKNLDFLIDLHNSVDTLQAVSLVNYDTYDKLATHLDMLCAMQSLLGDINDVEIISYDPLLKLNSILQIFTLLYKEVEQLMRVSDIPFIAYENLIVLLRELEYFQTGLTDISKNTQTLGDVEYEIDTIIKTLDSIYGKVICPVKGEVFYTEAIW